MGEARAGLLEDRLQVREDLPALRLRVADLDDVASRSLATWPAMYSVPPVRTA
jgi:hypothetical protein